MQNSKIMVIYIVKTGVLGKKKVAENSQSLWQGFELQGFEFKTLPEGLRILGHFFGLEPLFLLYIKWLRILGHFFGPEPPYSLYIKWQGILSPSGRALNSKLRILSHFLGARTPVFTIYLV